MLIKARIALTKFGILTHFCLNSRRKPQKYGQMCTGYKMNGSLFFIIISRKVFRSDKKKHEDLIVK